MYKASTAMGCDFWIIRIGQNSDKMPVGYLYDRYLDRKDFLGQGQLCPPKNSSYLGHRKGTDSEGQLSPKYSVGS